MAEYVSREDCCEATCGKENREGYKTYVNCHMTDAPTIDVRPVKHGRCVFDNEGYERCSICNEHETGLRYFYYCPNCGVKMDRGADDENE